MSAAPNFLKLSKNCSSTILPLVRLILDSNESIKVCFENILSTDKFNWPFIFLSTLNKLFLFLSSKWTRKSYNRLKFRLFKSTFKLNVELNSLNFNSLGRLIIALDEKNKKGLFKFNKKINGQLNLSVDKIFSKHTFIDSFESRIGFTNGNIIFEQFLLNLKKLGAADITGIIQNDEKFINFKFEKNIFIDNLKRFYNRFGIYNKQNIPSNLYISGNLDLLNLNLRLHEISSGKKFVDEEMVYIEKEFNDLVLEDGYASLFNFVKLKEFVRLVATETNWSSRV